VPPSGRFRTVRLTQGNIDLFKILPLPDFFPNSANCLSITNACLPLDPKDVVECIYLEGLSLRRSIHLAKSLIAPIKLLSRLWAKPRDIAISSHSLPRSMRSTSRHNSTLSFGLINCPSWESPRNNIQDSVRKDMRGDQASIAAPLLAMGTLNGNRNTLSGNLGWKKANAIRRFKWR
jgi:hypothetical protein